MNGRTARKSALPLVGCRLTSRRIAVLLQLPVQGQLGVRRIEAHLDIARIAQSLSGRKLDPHDVRWSCTLSEYAMLVGESTHEVHGLDERISGHEGIRVGRRR